ATLPDFSTVPPRHWMHQVRVNRFVYASAIDELCSEAGVSIRLHEMPAFVQEHDDRLALVVAGKTGLGAILTKKIVDATGDANVAHLMDYPLQSSDALQPGTLAYQ